MEKNEYKKKLIQSLAELMSSCKIFQGKKIREEENANRQANIEL